MTPVPEPASRQPSLRGSILSGLVAAALFALIALPRVVHHHGNGRSESDEIRFHLPTILQFAQDLPHPDLHDYLSATTPGYHLLMAAVRRCLNLSVPGLRIANLLLTCGWIATLAAALSRSVAPVMAVVLTLPLICSAYTYASGVYFHPDNFGWWLVLTTLLIALRPHVDAWTFGLGGVLLAMLVFVRQSHLWAASLLWLAGWLGNTGTSEVQSIARGRSLRVWLALLSTLPAFLIVLYFLHLWHGATPPGFQANHPNGADLAFQHQGINPATPCLFLVILGLMSTFYAPVLWGSVREISGSNGGRTFNPVPAELGQPPDQKDPTAGFTRLLVAGAIVGLLIAILPRTTFSVAEGRASGVWILTRWVPTFANRSPVFIVLGTLGGAAAVCWWRVLKDDRRGLILCLGCIPFLAAQTVNAAAWQRYIEPWLLMIIPLGVAELLRQHAALSSTRPHHARPSIYAIVGSIALALCLALATLRTLHET